MNHDQEDDPAPPSSPRATSGKERARATSGKERSRSPIVLALLGALLLGSIFLGVRVFSHERSELEHESLAVTVSAAQHLTGATAISARLTKVTLRAGDDVFVEVCSPNSAMPTLVQDQLHVAVLLLSPPELMLRVPLDRAHGERAQRNEAGACIALGGGAIALSGDYSVDAVFDGPQPTLAAMTVPLYVRLLARAPLGPLDYLAFIGCALPVLALLLWSLLRRPSPDSAPASPTPTPTPATGHRPTSGLGLTPWAALLALTAMTQVPLFGATLGLVKGLLLATMEAWLAVWLSASSLRRLAWQRPARPALATALALLAAGVLTESARWSIRLLPSSGPAPIQTFISWPSGLLAFAGLGVLLPVAEELFFRGYLFRAVERRWGTWAGAALSCALFVALHVQQTFGQWGSLLAITATGITLTLLRALTGSTLVPAVTHVLYNLVLSVRSL